MNTFHQSLSRALLILAFIVPTLAGRVQAAPPDKVQEHFFAAMKAGQEKPAVAGHTKTVGSPTGLMYSDTLASGGIIVGFDFWTSNYGKFLVINGVCPIYQNAKGRTRGKPHGNRNGNLTTLEARDGYAVSGVTAKAGDRMDQAQVEFMRINFATLNLEPGTIYKSKWVGGSGGRYERHLTGGDKPVIGIFGASGDELDRFGLLFYAPK
ncbi:MAG: hypothetical protein JWO94_482 [Verrucomicrobiaceae bacterium]|nr:hypothetical protein [Verrucomicrobiaceae bacterium]